MDDKDFLGYFNQLAPPSTVDQIKAASSKIVSTLVAIGQVGGRKASTDSSSQTKEAEKAEQSLKKKYLTGDLGEKVSADLNYTLKRLVRGLNSDNHAVKQGFFLASVMVLNKFKNQIDFDKYLKHMFNETKVASGMKSAETNNNSIGRMMCISACVEAKVFGQGIQVNHKILKVIVGCLTELYQQNDFIQESISAIFTKILHQIKEQKQIYLSTIEIIMEQLVIKKSEEGAQKGGVDFKSTVLSDSNKLGLFLRLKEAYQAGQADGMSKGEYSEVFNYKILADKKNLKQVCYLVQRQTYLYPRLHSSLPLLLNEISSESKTADKAKLMQQLINSVIVEFLFNDEVFAQMKSMTKFKFLHIGLRFTQLVLQNIQSWDTKQQNREQLLENLIKPNFMKILVKNVSSQKNQLHEAAVSLKDTIVQFISSSNLSGEYSLKLLQQLFGPNSNLRFSTKRNLDLLKVLTSRFEEAQVSQYFKFLLGLFNNSPIEEHYPSGMNEEDETKKEEVKENDSNDDEDEKPSDEAMRKDLIKTFALNQMANFPQMFRTQLTSEHVTSLIDVLVKVTYFHTSGDKQSQDIQQLGQFKLFGVAQMLHKIKLGDLEKGMKNHNDLWISEINASIQKQAASNKIKSPLITYHQEQVKFIKDEISTKRAQLQKVLKKNDEQSFKVKTQFKKLIAFELLFHNLALLIMIPGSAGGVAEETQQDIEEMKVCFQKLKLTENIPTGKDSSNKRAKKDGKQSEEQEEALQVLFDFLISLLTKQQSFLREIANFAFKQFCSQISTASLMNMMQIMQTPNVEANKMLFDEDEEAEGAEGDEVEGAEDEEMEEDEEDDDEDDEDESE
eukprot:403362109